MKTFGKIVVGLVVCLIVLLVVVRFTGLEPGNNTPGLWLRGNVATAPVTDWSYTDNIQTDMLQTNTPYLLPHSVRTWCIAYNHQLYLATSGAATRSWPHNVARDPHVRLKIGDQLFDRTLVMVTDPAEKDAVIQVRAKKYKQKYPPPAGVTLTVYRVEAS